MSDQSISHLVIAVFALACYGFNSFGPYAPSAVAFWIDLHKLALPVYLLRHIGTLAAEFGFFDYLYICQFSQSLLK